LKRDVAVGFVDIGGFYFHHCLIFLSINTNFIVFGLSQEDKIHDISHLKCIP
jgi:hypothetical protein